MTTRHIIGVAVGSGLEGVDAALVAIEGTGLAVMPKVLKSLRLPFAADLKEQLLQQPLPFRSIDDAVAHAVRKVTVAAGVGCRDAFSIGLQTPNHDAFATTPEAIADATGITVLTSFAAHDLAAGGRGAPLAALPEYLIARSSVEDRLLIHLGGVTSLTFIPANAQTIDILAWDAGPGGQLLDTLTDHGTRGKGHHDTGGTRAVQGQPNEELLVEWSRHPFIPQPPPKVMLTDAFDDAFADRAIEDERIRGGNLNDLLCTATHFIARCVGIGVHQWLPTANHPRGIYVSGGGTRNGFLWQLLQQQFPQQTLHRSDDIGMPFLARNAVIAALSGVLTLDGVTGNLPHLTGATGGRRLGRIVPGDPRNWAAVASWTADCMTSEIQASRAA